MIPYPAFFILRSKVGKGLELDHGALCWMLEGEIGCMQKQGVTFLPITVEYVADNGAAKTLGMGCMDAELMRPAGKRSELNPGPAAFDGEFFPQSDSYFAMERIMNLKWAVVGIEPKGELYMPGIGFY